MQLLSSLILALISLVFSPSISPRTQVSYLPQIQAVFPTATKATQSSDGAVLTVTLADPSEVYIPAFMHRLFPLCQQLQPSAIQSIQFKTIDNPAIRQADCSSSLAKYASTGSLSYALWELSYSSPSEQAIANQMYSASTYAESIKLGESLIATYPTAPNVYDLGFWHYLRSGELQGAQSETHYQLAKKYYKQALDTDPDFAPAHASYAYTLADSVGLTPEVIHHFDEAKRLDPGWSFAWMNQGMVTAYRGRKTEGLALLKQAVMANPKFPDQSRVIDNFLCLSRSLKHSEPADFYTTYHINPSKQLSFCPF